ncbi:MAG: hypothetical protein JXR19_09270 [Bacteroidia bacterium]
MKQIAFLTMGFAILLLSSCLGSDVKQVQGLKPVYGTVDDLTKMIKHSEVQDLVSPGKIYVKDQLLLINESLKGVHIYDNSDPSNPINTGFIEIPGNLDVAMKGNLLYADYLNGLVTIDISDIQNPVLKDFNSDYNSKDNGQLYPPSSATSLIGNSQVYFECPDKTKGLIIGWDVSNMPEPQCYLYK